MGERGSAREVILIRKLAYPPLPRGIKGRTRAGWWVGWLVYESSRRVRESRVGASSSWPLLPSASEENEPSVRGQGDQPAVPRLRQRDGASTIPPFDPEHQQFPSPISRAEIVPEAPFVAWSGYTCRHEVRAADHIGGGSDSRSGTRRWTTRSGKSQLFFFLGVLCECLWVAPVWTK